MERIETIAALEAIYGEAVPNALVKVADRITPDYAAWIDAAPFCALATVGPEGLDCTPRGDDGPVATILDDRTLALPDWRGNNRIDSLRNIVRDPRVAVMFLIPGSGTVIRVNGTALVTADAGLRDRFAAKGMTPRTVVLITVGEVYFQCAKAVLRARLWSGGIADVATLPTPGDILKGMAGTGFDAEAYDRDWPARARATLW